MDPGCICLAKLSVLELILNQELSTKHLSKKCLSYPRATKNVLEWSKKSFKRGTKKESLTRS